MTVTVLMAAGPGNWDRYAAPLRRSLADLGLQADLVQDAAPEAHAASTFKASAPDCPSSSASNAPRCSWPVISPESILPT